jgi:hypothetical protein
MNLKRLFGGVVIANNGFDKERANEALAEGQPFADMAERGTSCYQRGLRR